MKPRSAVPDKTGKQSLIQLHISQKDAFPREERHEVEGDIYVMSSPLCRGYVRLESDGRSLYEGTVRPGMLRVMSPGEIVRLRIESPSHAMVLTFPGPLLREALTVEGYQRGLNTFIDPILQPTEPVASLCRALTAARAALKTNQLMTDSVGHALLACVVHTKRPISSRFGKRALGLSQAEIRTCSDYAEAHLTDGIELVAWAQQLNMTAVEFTRRFQVSLHTSPYAWFQHRRIARAKVLLLETKRSLADIALEAGFSGQSHFTFVFRKVVGCSPGRWRRSL